eukprot:11891593-Ditylum_brightwellii.AAC.1
MKEFTALICDKYGIKQKPITTRNPQGNSIVKGTHQTICNLLHTFKIGMTKLDPDDPWGSILSAVMFTLWSTVHIIHKATPMQLVFGVDVMLNVTHLANRQYIQENQQKTVGKNNK